MKRKCFLAIHIVSVVLLLVVSSCKKSDTTSTNSNTPTVPVLITTAASGTTASSVQTGGTITSDGGAAVTTRGVCWRTASMPTIADNKTSDGTGTGGFASSVTTLNANVGYYIRAYATNSVGTGYGNEIFILTSNGVPSLTTQPVVETNHKWISGGTNVWSGGANITEKGVCWGITANPTVANIRTSDGIGTNGYSSTVAFSINSTYYVRAYATNSFGTGYGNQVTATTGISIGLSYGGGIIFYVDNTGQHGLIAATGDQGNAIPWAPGNLFATATNAQSTTDGSANTTKIISVYGNSGLYAAKLCRDYRGGNFTDWFLPSNNQLNTLYAQKDAVGGFPAHQFITSFDYWTSTEYDYFRAWDQDFNYDVTYYTDQKNQLNYVRAIRTF